MADRTQLAAVAVAILLALGFVAVASNPGLLPTGEYERTTVTVVDNGSSEQLAAVDVRVADSTAKRYTGLSETESLGADEGMLFVHESEDEYDYVMRGMSFPIDIVFVDSDGRITAIHHAELPADGADSPRYSGRGRYVLEVPYEYTDDHNITVGDRVRIKGEWGPSSD
jgi:uncharacterized membrane protein (UPF0127 family)